MVKVVTLDEAINRYAESSLVSAVRLRRYWLSQGASESEAIEKAVNQASGMMASSGASLDKLIELFRELKGACDAFVEILDKVNREQTRE